MIENNNIDGYDESKENKLITVQISEIAGGTKISTRDVGDEILIDDITDTVGRFPGAASSLLKKTFAAFKNGFTESLDMERKIQLMYADLWKEYFGYSVVLVQGKNVEALHPLTYMMGFVIDKIDDLGNPARIRNVYKANEQKDPIQKYYYAYDGSEGFFVLRRFGGLKEIRGPPALITLVDPLRVQNALYLKYMEHAEWQAISHPVFKIKDLDDTKYNRVKSDLIAPRTDKAVILDFEDDFWYDGPMSGAGTWNPIEMMRYGDNLISRETNLSIMQLTGEAAGQLSSERTNKAEWFDSVSEYQMIYLPQYKPILLAIGLPDEIEFNNPYEPIFEAKMEMIKLFREATEGLIDPKQVVEYMNSLLGLEKDKKFRLDPHYEEKLQIEMDNAKGMDKEGNDKKDKESAGK